MADYLFYAFLLLAGLAGGLLAGLLGIGGGIFFILVLPGALGHVGVPYHELPPYIVANSLFGTFFSAVASVLAHRRKGAKGFWEGLRIGIPAVVTGLVVLVAIVHRPWFDATAFNGLLIGFIGILLVRTLLSLRASKRLKAPQEVDQAGLSSQLTVIGAAAGTASSLTGLGGGIVVVPLLRQWLGYPAAQANYLSSITILLSSLAATLTSYLGAPAGVGSGFGYVLPEIAFPLAAGVVLAAPYGVALSLKIAPDWLTLAFAAFLLVVLVQKVLAFV